MMGRQRHIPVVISVAESRDFRYSQESNFAVFSDLVVILGADVSYRVIGFPLIRVTIRVVYQ